MLIFQVRGRRQICWRDKRERESRMAGDGKQLDLIRAPYASYGLMFRMGWIYRPSIPSDGLAKLLDLGRAPYVLYGVKYIDPVSLCQKCAGLNPKKLNKYTLSAHLVCEQPFR